MAAVGAAVATVDPALCRCLRLLEGHLIEGFGRGAAAFPVRPFLVDSTFVRNLSLSDDELALILSHEAAHALPGTLRRSSRSWPSLGKEKLPTARTALLEFLAKDSYATEFQPKARQQDTRGGIRSVPHIFRRLRPAAGH